MRRLVAALLILTATSSVAREPMTLVLNWLEQSR